MNSHDDHKPELDDPRVVEALDEYLAALEAGQKPDRQTFLARHADVAAALAECLDGMEALHEASSATQQTAGPWAGQLDWQPGTPLGDFRILREIGRGGMGVVYEAEQLSLGRRIALKVLPFALTLDPRQLQRFKNEARAAAQLHHQHIVPVYYVGSERGVHFYAMQYIEGQSLAEAIQGLRQLAGIPPVPSAASRRVHPGGLPTAGMNPAARPDGPHGESTGPFPPPLTPPAPTLGREVRVKRDPTAITTSVAPVNSLATAYSQNSKQFYRAVARLGIQAAEALEHAHEYGVVHRDIKPGNLLVDGHGHLWVTDFGLAQFQTDAGLTRTGDLVGTLRYMSPEQANGQHVLLDHRTDIYSLGATLYEVLTGQPAFDGADRQTLLGQILHDEPRPPRALEKSIPVELETVILKCLEKEVGRRYATARELADDLERFLGDQPIRARRATPAQRLRKWARRHPSVVAACLALCVLTALGSLVSAAMIRAEQKKTQEAYQQEQQRAREADERFRLAKEWGDDVLNLCEEELAGQPQFDGLRRRLLENALTYYQKLIEQRRDDPDAQEVLAANRDRVKQILADLAVLQGASRLPLLGEPAVLNDLGLEGDLRSQIAELSRRAGEQGWRLLWQNLSPEDRRQRLLDQARTNETEVEKKLTPEQLRRLRQIALQQQGPRAFEDPEVTAALKLTARQRERIRAIGMEAFGRRTCRPGPGEELSKPTEPQLSPVEQIVKDVLTGEQKERWRELTGATFKGPMRRGFFGPPPPPPVGPWRGRGGSRHEQHHQGPPPPPR